MHPDYQNHTAHADHDPARDQNFRPINPMHPINPITTDTPHDLHDALRRLIPPEAFDALEPATVAASDLVARITARAEARALEISPNHIDRNAYVVGWLQSQLERALAILHDSTDPAATTHIAELQTRHPAQSTKHKAPTDLDPLPL